MNLLLIVMGVLVASVLGLLLWSTGRRVSERGPVRDEIENLCLAGKHVINLPQIRQAIEPADFEYLSERSDAKMVRKIRKERRRIALRYLEGLREDFERLVDTAQAVAALSPEVEAKEEWKRFRLSAEFRIKHRLVWAKFALGAPTFPGLEGIAVMVSSLALDLERAVAKSTVTAMGPAAPPSA